MRSIVCGEQGVKAWLSLFKEDCGSRVGKIVVI